MSNYLKLTKILMRSGLMLSDNVGHKKHLFRRFITILICIGLIPITVIVAFVTWRIAHNLVELNQQAVALSIVLNFTSIFALVFGITVILNVFYFSNDVEFLLPLPLKPYQIVGAKFTVALANESIMQVLMIIGAFIGYAIASNVGVLYWVYSIIGIFTVPIVPLIYCAVVSMLIMRFTSFISNKDFINKVSGILVLAITIGITSSIGLIRNIDLDLFTEMMLEGNNSFVKVMHRLFPHIEYLVNGIAHTSLKDMLIYLSINGIFLVIFLLIAEKTYYKGVVGLSATSTKRKIIQSADYDRTFRPRHAVITYFWREIKLLYRTPVYFINCVLINFIWPFFIYVIFSMYGQMADVVIFIGRLAFAAERTKMFIVFLVIAMSVFICAANCISSTIISREGKGWYFMKYIPMDYMRQLNIKAMTSISIGSVGTFIYILVLAIYFKAPLFMTISCLIISLLIDILIGYTGMLIDLFNPKLNWDDEQNALRQNFNTFIFMFSAIAGGFVFCYLLNHMMRTFTLSFETVTITAIIVLLVSNLITYTLCKTAGVRRLRELGND